MRNEAIVLHSGGLDSTTALFWARKKFDNVVALNINYGQKHSIETFISRKLCDEYEIQRIEIDISGLKFLLSTSSLVGSREIAEKEYPEKGIISTYVPMRNTLLGLVAGIVAEIRDINNIVLGIHASDSPNYPDTRPEWASALETVLTTGSKFAFEGRRVVVHTPFIDLKKKDIILIAKELEVPFELTWSCYSPRLLGNIVKPCMECPSCNARKKAFEEAGIQDTLSYIDI
ncbi:MAG: 7-cyano-7-deazaguanine synthase QueC [Spirochaetia bacterium]|nr:7-cyano-7-deazaguanine synthase QueC [Spirochaetota bacterium]MCX8096540.1 7-cyano-7-deazaguanine synthase QueC [Spirochaetota bacterium]MDW8112698.1 7-cyano-7-deazaguanine synthase QueC [Spirochaetia bacterium]